jgi:hypothetical protein
MSLFYPFPFLSCPQTSHGVEKIADSFNVYEIACTQVWSRYFKWPTRWRGVEGRGIHSRWYHWIFHWRNLSGRTVALGSTQPVTKLVPSIFPGGKRRPARRTDTFTTFMCRVSWNLGASTSWNSLGLQEAWKGIALHFLSVARCVHKTYFVCLPPVFVKHLCHKKRK